MPAAPHASPRCASTDTTAREADALKEARMLPVHRCLPTNLPMGWPVEAVMALRGRKMATAADAMLQAWGGEATLRLQLDRILLRMRRPGASQVELGLLAVEQLRFSRAYGPCHVDSSALTLAVACFAVHGKTDDGSTVGAIEPDDALAAWLSMSAPEVAKLDPGNVLRLLEAEWEAAPAATTAAVPLSSIKAPVATAVEEEMAGFSEDEEEVVKPADGSVEARDERHELRTARRDFAPGGDGADAVAALYEGGWAARAESLAAGGAAYAAAAADDDATGDDATGDDATGDDDDDDEEEHPAQAAREEEQGERTPRGAGEGGEAVEEADEMEDETEAEAEADGEADEANGGEADGDGSRGDGGEGRGDGSGGGGGGVGGGGGLGGGGGGGGGGGSGGGGDGGGGGERGGGNGRGSAGGDPPAKRPRGSDAAADGGADTPWVRRTARTAAGHGASTPRPCSATPPSTPATWRKRPADWEREGGGADAAAAMPLREAAVAGMEAAAEHLRRKRWVILRGEAPEEQLSEALALSASRLVTKWHGIKSQPEQCGLVRRHALALHEEAEAAHAAHAAHAAAGLGVDAARARHEAAVGALGARVHAEAARCLRLLGLGREPVYQPALLRTLPGALPQKPHRDTGADATWSVLTAVTPRQFLVRGLDRPLELNAGDVLVFDGRLCHAGAGLPSGAGAHAIASFAYAGSGITEAMLTHTFACD